MAAKQEALIRGIFKKDRRKEEDED